MAMEQALKTIRGISFAVFSPNEIRKYSVAEITQPETYDEDGMPIQGGLMDSRLGTLEPGQKCATCGNPAGRCPGHFGHIELAEPVLHVAFVEEINKLLQITCRNCGRILLPQQELDAYKAKLSSKRDFTPMLGENVAKEIISKAKKVKLCPHCGKQQYQIEFTKPTIFHEITEEGGATRLLPVAIRERLERVTDEDLELVGINPKAARPEWFVLQVLPVPPLTVRPSITLESGMRSEDDLTHKLVDILRVNQRLKESKESGTPHLIVQDLMDLLHYHVTTYFDNEVSGIPQAHHRSGRPLKTLSQRLKGKEGRFRGSLSGKRVDFSSRTVISPDPNLDISEVGVPYEVAKKLTVPEKVSPWNIDFLKELVVRGPSEHPGANYIIRPDGVKIRLDFASDRKALADSLGPGYIVERHLMDGDIVLFNRQPSLHRMSVMAHYVKVLPYRTFRLHPSVCPPYNADFDGDEMNLHVPQSEEARSEALMLMRVQDQILSPRYGGPIIGGIRDFITGAFLLTKDDTFLTPDEFSNLALIGNYEGDLPEPAIKGPKPMYTGKQLFSLFLPKDLNYVLTSKWAKSSRSKETNDVVIKDGQLVSGVVDKAVIGAEEPDSLLHRITKDYGNEEARKFLNSVLSVVKSFLTRRGFTYGFDELDLPEQAKKEIKETIEEAYKNVSELIRKYKQGTLAVERGLSPEEALELYITNELARARDRAGRIADRALSTDNSGVVMARTGARGSSLNIGQMTAALGQQSVRGKRILKGYRGRALSHFQINDLSPKAKGFVESNYRDGLSPTELFFHAMGGREGLVDTAVRTQQSGYMQRRLVNALEHLKVEYDLTVRDPHGHIIQFVYGEDGVDPAKSDHGRPVNLDRLVETYELLNKSRPKLGKENTERLLSRYKSKLNPRLVEELTSKLSESYLTEEGAKGVLDKVLEALDYSRVEPGEAAGIVAAQSIGEPGTQMSIYGEESIIIRKKGLVKRVKIGEFVDRMMENANIQKEGDTEWCEVPEEAGIEVLSLNNLGFVEWKKLKSVSRHKSKRPLIVVRTASGRKIIATDNHSFVTRIDNKIVPILGRDLRAGDLIPVMRFLPVEGGKRIEMETVSSSGLASKIVMISIGNVESALNSDILHARSMLRELFDSHGYINTEDCSLCLNLDSMKEVEGISLLLARFGIYSTWLEHENRFRLSIPSSYVKLFRDAVGSGSSEKERELKIICDKELHIEDGDVTCGFGNLLMRAAERLGFVDGFILKATEEQRLERRMLSRYINMFEEISLKRGVEIPSELNELKLLLEEEVVWDKIIEINTIEPEEETVYDVSVPGLETFVTAEGIFTHNTLRTFHYAGVRERDVTLGLPRLMELVDARRVPSTPSMDIYLDEAHRYSNEKAVKVARAIRFTKVANVVEYSEVDPMEGIKLYINEKALKESDSSLEQVAEAIETGKRNVQIDKERNIIRVNLENADLSALFTLRNKILNMRLKGIPGIERVTVVNAGEEWFIQTAGSNLAKVLEVEGVDKTRVYTNSIHEIVQIFGIEAARAALVREIMSTLDEQGLEVDIRHVFLVADLMTSKGFLQQIGRHGVAGSKSSVLARAAFEITVPTLAEAAVQGQVEDLKGVTENVIVGLPIPVGTGMIELYMG